MSFRNSKRLYTGQNSIYLVCAETGRKTAVRANNKTPRTVYPSAALDYVLLFGFAVFIFVVPRIEFAQFLSDLFELMLRLAFAAGVEVRAPSALVFGDPLRGKRAVLNFRKYFFLFLFGHIEQL